MAYIAPRICVRRQGQQDRYLCRDRHGDWVLLGKDGNRLNLAHLTDNVPLMIFALDAAYAAAQNQTARVIKVLQEHGKTDLKLSFEPV
jgi:hypothetical protein